VEDQKAPVQYITSPPISHKRPLDAEDLSMPMKRSSFTKDSRDYCKEILWNLCAYASVYAPDILLFILCLFGLVSAIPPRRYASAPMPGNILFPETTYYANKIVLICFFNIYSASLQW
jgi:hypothetical protein